MDDFAASNLALPKVGLKYDSNKPKVALLPPKALLEVAEVLTYGAEKYAPDNWKKVENYEERYLSAALRHILAVMDGEYLDRETTLPHLAHAICSLMFILELGYEQTKR